MTLSTEVTVSRQRYLASRERLAKLTEQVNALELDRQQMREDAVKRLQDSGLASSKSAAEKITHLDAPYAEFLRRLNDLEVEKLRAATDAEAARMAVEHGLLLLRLQEVAA